MSGSSQDQAPRALVLVDDGWRWEKRDILNVLADGWTFDVATHDPLSRDKLSEHFEVHLLPSRPLRRGLLYTVVMFFARSLDTKLVRYRERLKFLSRPPAVRFMYRLREIASKLRIRCYRYSTALAFLYRGSNDYAEILKPYHMLVYSPVTVRDKRILFEAKAAGLRVVSWVFSWDNPMKDNEFLINADDYLVWNKENRQDLIRYHQIDPAKIHIVGPAQFDFFIDLQKKARGLNRDMASEPYVLYACAMGIPVHVKQEIKMILAVRKLLDDVMPGMPLWVRPYPFRADKEFSYTDLMDREGIRLLNFGELDRNRILVEEQELEEKYNQIAGASCLVNFGSTLGLEASFSDTPILQIGFNLPFEGPDYMDIYHALESEHLEYMIDTRFPNTSTNLEELRRGLEEVLCGSGEAYRAYTDHLQSFAHPLQADSYRVCLREELKRLDGID